MIAVCPMCWRTVAADARVCGACGADLGALGHESFMVRSEATLALARMPVPAPRNRR